MKEVSSIGLVALLSVTLLTPASRGVTYTAILLHPAEFWQSIANGASGMSQAGSGRISTPPTFTDHGLLWNGSADTVVDLNPLGFSYSAVLGISDSNQVGFGCAGNSIFCSGTAHAMLWSGTAESAVDLNPPGLAYSAAYGVSGASQTGYASNPSAPRHAMLWNGTAESAVDLNPPGYVGSLATGISGVIQVGRANKTGEQDHAILWTGTAESAVDLNPAGFSSSEALGVSGATEVGVGMPTAFPGRKHALLWNGTPESAIDLNPSGFSSSQANAISDAGVVGYCYSSGTAAIPHALLWNGTPASVVDLNSYVSGLQPNFTGAFAEGISEDGIIVGYAEYRIFHGQSIGFAVLWSPVPEPSSCVLVTFGLAGISFLGVSRRRCFF